MERPRVSAFLGASLDGFIAEEDGDHARVRRVALRGQAGDPRAVLETLGGEGARRVYADGGQVVSGFLAAGCLHALTVSIVPVVLGRGVRLFADDPGMHRLALASTRTFESGVVQLTYGLAAATT